MASANARIRLLIVDADPAARGALHTQLTDWGYAVEMASQATEAMEQLQRHTFHVLIATSEVASDADQGLLAHRRRHYPDLPVIVMGASYVNAAVKAMREGAADYITKPVQPEMLKTAVIRAVSADLSLLDETEDPFGTIVGQDPAMQKVFEMVRSVARTSSTVLLEGESGTGKRVIAQAIHRADPRRRNHPFVEVSCGALPETLLESELFGHVKGSFTGAIRDKQGRFEVANGGTILLDEIDAFSQALQVKLLRVIQDKLYERVGDTRTQKVDVRIVAATNRKLRELAQQGKFREDLFYRLNVIAIHLPPLRDRRSDLPVLIERVVERHARAAAKPVKGLSDEAMAVLLRYPWPGNIRELENILERAVILSQSARLEVADLPEDLCATASHEPEAVVAPAARAAARPTNGGAPSHESEDAKGLKESLRTPERELILRVLNEERWNRSAAAKRLGIHRSTLYQKMRILGIET